MDLPSSNFETLEDGLSELFAESVTIEGGEQRKLGAAELSIVECHVNSLEGTSTSINEQRRYHVEVEYSQGGKATTGIVHAYGPAVDKARKYQENGNVMRVLVDPSDPDHLIGIDLIMIFEQ